jgi:mRNA interferase MazF
MPSPRRTGTPKPIGGRRSETKHGRAYCPDAGDFIWIDLDPTTGHEQRGRRPALVLSRRAYNERAQLCVACPITIRAKGYPFEAAIPSGHGLSGVILADQPRSLAWPDRDVRLIDRAGQGLLDDVREKIAALIEIT